MIKDLVRFTAFALVIFATACTAEQPGKPNILYILADDLGYGDVQILNPENGLIKTPVMDKLAEDGMIFTDAHTSSSVCTPSRYSILTGRYNWRTPLQAQVLMGFDKPLIEEDRFTVADLLKQAGYNTACIGKWHLGLGFPTIDDQELSTEGLTNIDWNGRIAGGPVDLGFDYFYGISASLNIAPYIYMENDRFVGECTTIKGFNRKGPSTEDFEAVDTLPILTQKTVDYIKQQDASTPFFAYVSLTSPHTPIVPTPEWEGKSGISGYADFVMHTDAIIGEMLDALEEKGLAQNTVVIVTSDNGFSKWGGLKKLEEAGHTVSAHFRGSKSDIWEGGHRVPHIVRWPAKIKPGSLSEQTIVLNDLIATCAELTGVPLPQDAGEDSVSFLPAIVGEPIQSSRAGIVHHSFSGHFAYRLGKWKLCLAKASGGWTYPTENDAPADAPIAQLYDMEADPGETTNLYATHPEIAERLLAQLKKDVENGRSTAGPKLKNDVDNIVLWKSGK
ncbi:arylsulfatase [Pelagicoccus sp. SDUM812005]|uniref:sulfatase family protein n=1 Tax=Pelagicoccus sp. SDUM812005 TaxID=3041257 RepID=UPI00280CBD74|nr:arylsulfatase [Pelagicoccus sp. SDUM812005]MDQ8181560.1 arylsulfatase [Pelagicoccus sp. SDUM812005]